MTTTRVPTPTPTPTPTLALTPDLDFRALAKACGLTSDFYWRVAVAPAMLAIEPKANGTRSHIVTTLKARACFELPGIVPRRVEQAWFEAFLANPMDKRFTKTSALQLYGVSRTYTAIRMLTCLERHTQQQTAPTLAFPLSRYLAQLVPLIPTHTLDRLVEEGAPCTVPALPYVKTLRHLARTPDQQKRMAALAKHMAAEGAKARQRRNAEPHDTYTARRLGIHEALVAERTMWVLNHEPTHSGPNSLSLKDFVRFCRSAMPLGPQRPMIPLDVIMDYVHAHIAPRLPAEHVRILTEQARAYGWTEGNITQ